MITVIITTLLSVFETNQKTAQAWVDDGRLAQSTIFARVVATLAATTGDASGTIVDVTLRNEGNISYADFEQWDVIVHYVDDTGGLGIRWLPYSSSISDNTWTVKGIYLVASEFTDEVVDPDVLNAGEEIVVRLRVTPPMQSGSTGRVVLTPTRGQPASIFFTG